jgi:hypothetical protein
MALASRSKRFWTSSSETMICGSTLTATSRSNARSLASGEDNI